MTPQSEVDAWMRGYLAGYHDGARGNAYRGREPISEFTWESTGDNRLGQPTGRWVGPIEVGEP